MKLSYYQSGFFNNYWRFPTTCKFFFLLVLAYSLSSCSAGKLQVKGVAYQSLNTTCPHKQGTTKLSSDSRILLTFAIDQDGKLIVFVNNLTDEILTIDQQLSFLIDTDGQSKSYYDNTVYASTHTNYNFSTKSFNMNLGSLASVLGVGGRLGTLFGGMNLGNSSTTGSSDSQTSIMQDEKRINLGPRGCGVMSKVFPVKGIGRSALDKAFSSTDYKLIKLDQKSSPLQFQVCISYSFDNGETFSRLDTKFYVDSMFAESVPDKHKTGDAVRKVISSKPDLLGEPWYLISIMDNIPDNKDNYWGLAQSKKSKIYDFIVNGLLFNYE